MINEEVTPKKQRTVATVEEARCWLHPNMSLLRNVLSTGGESEVLKILDVFPISQSLKEAVSNLVKSEIEAQNETVITKFTTVSTYADKKVYYYHL